MGFPRGVVEADVYQKFETPSLRANGSRKCAPDDRLREAIHLAAQRKTFCADDGIT
jgi:hypothetical protein